MKKFIARYALVALSFAGSAILLYSCDGPKESDPAAEEVMMTEYSDNLSIVESMNGRRSFHFQTPLLEGYSMAREPYREFRKGIKITTYKNDSLTEVDAVLTGNYAINYTDKELWEVKGNVSVEKTDGKSLYTQQLFWNARTKKIYSNVDSKFVQNNGRDVFIGEGFESDEEFKEWRFRRSKGRLEVEMKPTVREDADSTAVKPSEGADTLENAAERRSNASARDRRRSEAAAGKPQPERSRPEPAKIRPATRETGDPQEVPMMRRATNQLEESQSE